MTGRHLGEHSNLDVVEGGVRVQYDWFDRVIPESVRFGRNVYVNTSYGFDAYASERQPGLVFGDASGAYLEAILDIGPHGQVTIGDFTAVNGAGIVCRDRITIGSHVLLAWGTIVTDSWVTAPGAGPLTDLESRRATLRSAAADPRRLLPALSPPCPVTIEDNVWVGFDAVILPGVTLGQGCVVGSKSVVATDVPPYAVVVGNPARVVRMLDPDDTAEVRALALRERVRQS